uniref:RING-type domain-containing protein n=1 Tax=Nelumbo nucifera TaxID=4432 RepID=A0A822XJB8_NELNU|nr:TPA_asm: hypothetical protein HUJ06_021830 [Nelumbo nucifera]
MGESTMGAIVPSVKAEARASAAVAGPSEAADEAVSAAATAGIGGAAAESLETGVAEFDKDFLCPICMQIIRDAFLTICGHSFCYMCIITHLHNKNDCPCCGNYLTNNQLYPNFLLNKLLKKTSARQIGKTTSPVEHLRRALQQGCEVSVKELDSLLTILLEKKRKTEQEEAETNMQILLDFLNCLRKQKLEELNESIEFDRDDELFATAGVSRRIKVFEFSSVVNEPTDVHCPIVEMSTRSKLSCLSWNKYTKNHIASSDYEGIVTVWDVDTRQSVMEYEEHEKRAWSVDFSRTEPSMLVSGSDDCKVKIWCTKQEASVLNIDMKANICCVKYNPGSSIYVAVYYHTHVGSADHHIHYYDLRNISQPLHVFNGHKKAVSYVKFLSNNELASASTDSTLRLWDVKENLLVRTFRGHTNEKNFVGLTVNSEYIACGSETNEVFVYHKAISKPAAWHRFGSSDLDDTDDDGGSYFISAVCWKSDSATMLTANSQGTIKVLVLAA